MYKEGLLGNNRTAKDKDDYIKIQLNAEYELANMRGKSVWERKNKKGLQELVEKHINEYLNYYSGVKIKVKVSENKVRVEFTKLD